MAQTALQHLTDLAPTLKEAELRALLQLTAIAQASPDNPAQTIQPAAVELELRGTIGGIEVNAIADVITTDGTVIDFKTASRRHAEMPSR